VARQLAQVLASESLDVEGIELDFVIMPARVQPVEIGDAVDAEQHRLAIDDKRGRAVRRSRDSGRSSAVAAVKQVIQQTVLQCSLSGG
jgi:hypothetical protein